MKLILGGPEIPRDKMTKVLTPHLNSPWLSHVVFMYYEEYNNGLWDIAPDVAVAQMCLETGFGTSWWSQEPRRNLAGLGVTGEASVTPLRVNGPETWAYDASTHQYRKGLTFGNYLHAIQAHLAHLYAYTHVSDPDNRARFDPRFLAVRKALGTGKTISSVEELGGRWSTNPDYGRSLMALYDNLKQVVG